MGAWLESSNQPHRKGVGGEGEPEAVLITKVIGGRERPAKEMINNTNEVGVGKDNAKGVRDAMESAGTPKINSAGLTSKGLGDQERLATPQQSDKGQTRGRHTTTEKHLPEHRDKKRRARQQNTGRDQQGYHGRKEGKGGGSSGIKPSMDRDAIIVPFSNGGKGAP